MSQAPPDRRIGLRVAVVVPVYMSSARGLSAGVTENLSANGMFVTTDLRAEIGERLQLELRLPALLDVVQCIGEVRWVRDHGERSLISPGIGLLFVELSAAAQHDIERLLHACAPMFFKNPG